MTACVLDMFCHFYSVKNHIIANNSTTTGVQGGGGKPRVGILKIFGENLLYVWLNSKLSNFTLKN